MTTPSTRKTVNFMKPFNLGDTNEKFPPGDYVVDTFEAPPQGLAFFTYRRALTIIYLPTESSPPSLFQASVIDPGELEAAMIRDRERREKNYEYPIKKAF